MPHFTRRDFVRSSLIGASAGVAALSATTARSIEPLARTKGHHFKCSMAAYSYRDLLKASPPKLSLADFMDDCAAFGCDGTELTSYYLSDPPTPEYLRQLKADAFRRGLNVSGTAIRNDLCFPKGERRDAEIAHVKRWIEYADMMDAPVIRIFSGDMKPGQSLATAIELAVDGIEECCRHAAKFGVFLALENHGGITAKVDDMLQIVRGVDSPWFGVNMDTGNFYSSDIYGDLEKIAPYAINVQIKVLVKPAGQDVQPADFPRLATLLRSAGYRGYIVLEFEASGDPRTECARFMQELQQAFQA
jgi:sugar phosphate isomerase/epimerase